MRLGVLSPELELRKMRKEDGGSSWGGKGPLEKMDFCTLLFSRERKDESRMFASGILNATVRVFMNHCAK